MTRKMKPKAGDRVVLNGLPPGFFNDLPKSDQVAIANAIGTAVLLLDYGEDGRVELEFTDSAGTIHSIFVDLKYIHGVQDQ